MNQHFSIPCLYPVFGERNIPSPLKTFLSPHHFIDDNKNAILANLMAHEQPSPSLEIAGPRENIFWASDKIKVALVTCGGLAPGLNNVVQSIVRVLYDRYKVRRILGVPFGLQGFSHDSTTKQFQFDWCPLEDHFVQNIDSEAGSILGTSRGHSNAAHIVDALQLQNIQILFMIGGDGTLRGAYSIYQEVTQRNLPISVIGIPKTVDNDIPWVSKSFGFDTAVAQGAEAIRCAITEARSAYHGIGLVKIMGRHSGALAATAAAAVTDVDFVLIPEVDLILDGPYGFFHNLSRCILEKGYATIVVAEGTGQNLFSETNKEYDPSGNPKLNDIGRFLQEKILTYFKEQSIDVTLKYIDPSYILRSQLTSADDSIFCSHLGQHAVHAAMSGKTGLMIGYVHEYFTHIPLEALQGKKKRLDINSPLWLSLLASTGQPREWILKDTL